jgi:hypothetical protein
MAVPAVRRQAGRTMAGDLARIRSREVEREARARAQAKEAKDSKDR